MARVRPGLALAIAVFAACAPGPTAAAPSALELQEVAATTTQPRFAALSPDGRLFYVANFGAFGGKNLHVYDADTLALHGILDLAGTPIALAFSPIDPDVLWVANFSRDSVQLVDAAHLRVKTEVRLREGARPRALALSRDGKALFVAEWGLDDVAVINVEQGRVARMLKTGRGPVALALGGAATLYVASYYGERIEAFDVSRAPRVWGDPYLPAAQRGGETIAACAAPRDLAIAPDDRTLYVACSRDEALLAVELPSRTTRRLALAAAPRSIDVARDGLRVWSGNDDGSVAVVDTASWTFTSLDLPAMERSGAIAATRDGRRALVTDLTEGHVYLVGPRGEGGHPREALSTVAGWSQRRR